MDHCRRRVLGSAAVGLAGAAGLTGCSGAAGDRAYQAAVAQQRNASAVISPYRRAGALELVRYATLAPSSHNTQCWKFVIDDQGMMILPDLARRCPVVDPDLHHLFISLGCATENLVQAAAAQGLHAEPRFDPARLAIQVTLTPAPSQISPLYRAIALRQSTRGDFDGKPLGEADLSALARVTVVGQVQLHLFTDRPMLERMLASIIEANTAQIADPAFVRELHGWIRFNAPAALRSGDGLYSACTGNPNLPTWLGDLAMDWLYTSTQENRKLVRQLRSSAGLAVFVGASATPQGWVDVGRAFQRFALQATVLGIRTAMVNQPVEVAALRPQFASLCGLTGQRPDLVVRFGRGPAMPWSLRRPVSAVLA